MKKKRPKADYFRQGTEKTTKGKKVRGTGSSPAYTTRTRSRKDNL